jgi:hypothetical protein
VAGATPFRPEVDDHRLIALQDILLEGLGCHYVQSASFLGCRTSIQTQA